MSASDAEDKCFVSDMFRLLEWSSVKTALATGDATRSEEKTVASCIGGLVSLLASIRLAIESSLAELEARPHGAPFGSSSMASRDLGWNSPLTVRLEVLQNCANTVEQNIQTLLSELAPREDAIADRLARLSTRDTSAVDREGSESPD